VSVAIAEGQVDMVDYEELSSNQDAPHRPRSNLAPPPTFPALDSVNEATWRLLTTKLVLYLLSFRGYT
jgi:hypothetical protein